MESGQVQTKEMQSLHGQEKKTRGREIKSWYAEDILLNHGCVWIMTVLKYTILCLTSVNGCQDWRNVVITMLCGQLDTYIVIEYPFFEELVS